MTYLKQQDSDLLKTAYNALALVEKLKANKDLLELDASKNSGNDYKLHFKSM